MTSVKWEHSWGTTFFEESRSSLQGSVVQLFQYWISPPTGEVPRDQELLYPASSLV